MTRYPIGTLVRVTYPGNWYGMSGRVLRHRRVGSTSYTTISLGGAAEELTIQSEYLESLIGRLSRGGAA